MNIFKRRSFRKEIKSFKKHVKHTLVRDDDILSDSSKAELHKIQLELASLKPERSEKTGNALKKLSERFTKAIPAPNWKVIREYAEIVVVALTVAFGVRALYLQPFKIPTSSMQPTLFGIHYVEKKVIPNIPQPLNWLLYSTERAKLITEREGDPQGFYPPHNRWGVFPWSTIDIADVAYDLPGKKEKVAEYCFSPIPKTVWPTLPVNYTLCNGWLSQGDHLFVNRFSYHFSNPKRGDIVVFTTEGLKEDASGSPLTKVGFYYVKRMIGMPGDTLKVMDNNKLYVKTKNSDKFVPITAFNIPAIDRIYSGKGGYQGHFAVGRLAAGKEVKVPKECYFMLGDNSAFSADSRYWGFVPRRNIVGKALFVFWPFSRRWGITDETPALQVPTVIKKNTMNAYIPAMRLQ